VSVNYELNVLNKISVENIIISSPDYFMQKSLV